MSNHIKFQSHCIYILLEHNHHIYQKLQHIPRTILTYGVLPYHSLFLLS